MEKELLIDCKKATNESVKLLQKKFKSTHRTTAILGLSGGLDSTTVAFLCKKAGLDLKVVLLPYGYNPQDKSITNAREVIKALQLKDDQVLIIDIKPAIDAQTRGKTTRIRKGNRMARQRMTELYDLAHREALNGLVIGTENLSEYYLGYFTLHGDEAANINPIHGLFKTGVYQLAKYLGVPNKIIKVAPSAGLQKGQTDEGEFGFTYTEADLVLYYYFIKNYSVQDMVAKVGLNIKLIEKILDRVKNSQFKRDSVPSYKYYKD